MNTVVLKFDADWLEKHADDDVRPIFVLRDFLLNNYSEQVTILNAGYFYVELLTDESLDVKGLLEAIGKHLASKYDDFTESVLTIDGQKSEEESPKSQESDSVADQIRKMFGDRDGGTSAHKSTESVLAKIDSHVSANEFKALAHEINLLAPQFKECGTENIFLQQNYLFAINDGCGLKTFLNEFVDLINCLGLCSVSTSVNYAKLRRRQSPNDDPFEEVLSEVHNKGGYVLSCIDICDWMNDVNTGEFKTFLLNLVEVCQNSILVFRIPFIDKEVMDNVGRALNDVMFIRSVSFAPYTIEEVDKIAEGLLQNFGFSIEESAWKYFNARIREESSDGRFYGDGTIYKVVSELLYQKHLVNARAESANKVISLADTERLCNVDFVDDKSGLEMLDSLIGTEKIKARILEIISQIELVHNHKGMGNPCLHMRFVGNPGTGKTTVARIIGKILKEKNILRVGEFFEHSGRDFCGRYIGETAPKTLSMCREAYGSVLFIDEAYSLYKGPDDFKDYGREALDTLIAEMENHRNDFVVIMAGYTDEMENLLNGNAGLASRMPYTIEFPNFTREQLYDIFVTMCKNKVPYSEDMLADVKEYFLNLDEAFVSSREFSNARYVRNLYERVCAKAAMRAQLAGESEVVLTKEDFAHAIVDKDFVHINKKRNRIGFGN